MNLPKKRCGKCEKIKTTDEFYIDKFSKIGLSSYCKTCNKQKNKKNSVLTADIPRYRYREMVYGASRRGHSVEITLEQHQQILGPRICFYCDKNFSKDVGCGLNRIDSSKGYVMGNLKPCCGTCNKIMSNFTVDELKSRLIKIYKRITKGDPKK